MGGLYTEEQMEEMGVPDDAPAFGGAEDEEERKRRRATEKPTEDGARPGERHFGLSPRREIPGREDTWSKADRPGGLAALDGALTADA